MAIIISLCWTVLRQLLFTQLPLILFQYIHYFLGKLDILAQAETQKRLDELILVHGAGAVFIDCNEDIFDEVSLILFSEVLVAEISVFHPFSVVLVLYELVRRSPLVILAWVLEILEPWIEHIGLGVELLKLSIFAFMEKLPDLAEILADSILFRILLKLLLKTILDSNEVVGIIPLDMELFLELQNCILNRVRLLHHQVRLSYVHLLELLQFDVQRVQVLQGQLCILYFFRWTCLLLRPAILAFLEI